MKIYCTSVNCDFSLLYFRSLLFWILLLYLSSSIRHLFWSNLFVKFAPARYRVPSVTIRVPCTILRRYAVRRYTLMKVNLPDQGAQVCVANFYGCSNPQFLSLYCPQKHSKCCPFESMPLRWMSDQKYTLENFE